jgi:hypothetical protein
MPIYSYNRHVKERSMAASISTADINLSGAAKPDLMLGEGQ